MIRIKNLTAEDLTSCISLFETDEEEQQFIEVSNEKNATYTIEIDPTKITDDFSEHYLANIEEVMGNSSNTAFWDVYLTSNDMDNLSEYGIVEVE